MHRLFVAVRPPPAIRGQLLRLMDGVRNARWQDDGQLHVTLRFIGEVERPCAEDIAAALGSVTAPRFEIALSGAGHFGQGTQRGSLWAGVNPREPLKALHKKIDARLVHLGLEPERRAYLPHITIARLNRSAGPIEPFLADHGGLTSLPFPVEDFRLYQSTLGHGGAQYDCIARYPLG